MELFSDHLLPIRFILVTAYSPEKVLDFMSCHYPAQLSILQLEVRLSHSPSHSSAFHVPDFYKYVSLVHFAALLKSMLLQFPVVQTDLPTNGGFSAMDSSHVILLNVTILPVQIVFVFLPVATVSSSNSSIRVKDFETRTLSSQEEKALKWR